MWPIIIKGTSCRPSLFSDNEQNSVWNMKKTEGKYQFKFYELGIIGKLVKSSVR